MKNVITQTFLAILFLATYSSSIYSQDLPWIKVDGNQFVNENGEIILFKALNTSDPDKLDKDGHWDQEYSSQIKSWNTNLIFDKKKDYVPFQNSLFFSLIHLKATIT